MDRGTSTAYAGAQDIAAAAAELGERLPAALAPLAELAYNYRWSWLPGGPELFARVDRERFELCQHNPVRLLQEAAARVLRSAAGDRELLDRAAALRAQVAAELRRTTELADGRGPVAFFCAEYGVHVSLPVYAGGLGALAGDLLKQASDEALPMVAVGLMYRKGYFRQRVDATGWQHEYWIDTDPERLPAALVTGADGRPVTITVPIYEADVTAQIWRVDVGRVPLYLLDTDRADNGQLERWITARLYDADSDIRISQYVLLGVGGVRALRALGIEPGLLHLNEGHAALAPLELARHAGELAPGAGVEAARQAGDVAPAEVERARHGEDASDGAPDAQGLRERAAARTVFTTHTPVPAGNDAYPTEQIERATARLAPELGLVSPELIDLGRSNPGDPWQPFGVTQAALRLSRAANGVSRRHGGVAREMWSSLWPGRPVDGVPITEVTNGVHLPTWIGVSMRELLDRWLGDGWAARAADPRTWDAIAEIPDADLWAVRERQRAELLAHVRRQSTTDRLVRGDLRDYVTAAASALDERVLTIGFARRVATYKRLDLLTRDPEWTLALLGGERPVQVLLAGKAHPRDDEAKGSLQRLFGLKYARIVAERVAFLDDYDLAGAARLVRGCDLWLNVPRPPLEASGTSGMKSAVNGGLQCSVLDGWWAEAYDGDNGWALPGEVVDDHGAQDERDAHALHRMLDHEIVPAFYDRDGDGLPAAWLARMRRSLRTLAPRFSAARMLDQYVHGPYRGNE